MRDSSCRPINKLSQGSNYGIPPGLKSCFYNFFQTFYTNYTSQKVDTSRVELEVDAINLREALILQRYDLAPFGMIAKDTKFLTFIAFTSAKVGYNPRSCNKVADSLARSGSELVPS